MSLLILIRWITDLKSANDRAHNAVRLWGIMVFIPLLLWIFLHPNCSSTCWHDPHVVPSAPSSHAQSDLSEVKGDRGNGLNFIWPSCHGEVPIRTVPSLRTSNPRIPTGPPGKLNLVRWTLSVCYELSYLAMKELQSLHSLVLLCSVLVFIFGQSWSFGPSTVLKDIDNVYLKSYSGRKGPVVNMYINLLLKTAENIWHP